MPKIRRALISLSDKSGIAEFAKGLHGFGVEILSTGGTAKVLRGGGVPVVEISEYTGMPEILDGRLKTLHPKIHGGLLGMRGSKKHAGEMAANNIEPIDMVVVNLYPFEAAVARPGCPLEEAIENIDIGGPAMLRAAAKNWQDVVVVTDPLDYPKILEEMKDADGGIAEETCFKLAQKVFAVTARYDAAICNYINGVAAELALPNLGRANSAAAVSGKASFATVKFPSTLALVLDKVQDLRYGENPHQEAAFYRDSSYPLSPCGRGSGRGGDAYIASARQLHGKELSYNNIMDADAAIELARELSDGIAAVIVKHANPCGAALSGKSLADAFIKARDCDPVSAFGGIVAMTRPVDAWTAKAVGETFFEVIAAPGFEADALEILKAKKNLRLLELPSLVAAELALSKFSKASSHTVGFKLCGYSAAHNTLRKVGGGLLVSDADNAVEDPRKCRVVTKREPADEEYGALDFSWRVVKHVKSNAIVIAASELRATSYELRTLGIGAGQTSRVDSVKIAIEKMNDFTRTQKYENTKIRALASDAFFPFRDGVDLAADAGVTAIIQPGGSIRDEEVIKAADEHGIAMVFTGVRHFRH